MSTKRDERRYGGATSDDPKTHAIVVGGGCSALCAAHALSRRFDRVTVLDERAPGARQVPGGAPAWISARARLELEWLVPGIGKRLCDEGGRMFHVRHLATPDDDPAPLRGIECTTDRFFRVLSRLVEERANVTTVHRTRVEDLLIGGGRFTRVLGARVSRGSADGSWPRQELELDADVVIDASGPESRLLQRLAKPSADSSGWHHDVIEVADEATAHRWRIETCSALPEGYLPVGSTVLAAPSALAVRVTLAALSARSLEEAFAVGGPHEPGFAASFFHNQTRRHASTWRWLEDLAAMRDSSRPESIGTARGRYLLTFRRRARTDPELASLAARIDQLVDPPERVFEPKIVWRVLRASAVRSPPLRATG